MKLDRRNSFPGLTTKAFITFGLIFGAFGLCPAAISVNGQGPIVNSVHAGGPDVEDPDLPFDTGPGVDKNYSLAAFKYADGTVRGLLIDRFAGPDQGFRAAIDCVHVVGNDAWVSGAVTRGQTVDVDGNPFDLTGLFVRTRVQDNGSNNDPDNPDRIGFSIFRSSAPWICSEMRGNAFDMSNGQVTIR